MDGGAHRFSQLSTGAIRVRPSDWRASGVSLSTSFPGSTGTQYEVIVIVIAVSMLGMVVEVRMLRHHHH